MISIDLLRISVATTLENRAAYGAWPPRRWRLNNFVSRVYQQTHAVPYMPYLSVTDLEQLKAEKARLSDVVKVQNLTPEEVVRMNTEHETLIRSVEDLRVKVTETNKLVMSLEVSLTNRVATAEEVIDQYNTLLSSPGLIPPNEEDLTIELNMANSDLQQLVRGPDLRKVVRPTLSKWAEMYRVDIDAAKREKIVVDDEHDHVVNECDDLIQEIETEAAKVHALTEQAEEMREVTGFRFLTSRPTPLNLG